MKSLQSLESKAVLRNVVLIALLFSMFIVIIGSFHNTFNHKYVRAISIKGCRKPILNIYEKDSLLCCDHEKHLLNSICQASFDKISHTLSSKYALIIPFSPLLIHFANELILNVIYGNNKVIIFEKILTSTMLRLLIIGMILFFRTVNI